MVAVTFYVRCADRARTAAVGAPPEVSVLAPSLAVCLNSQDKLSRRKICVAHCFGTVSPSRPRRHLRAEHGGYQHITVARNQRKAKDLGILQGEPLVTYFLQLGPLAEDQEFKT